MHATATPDLIVRRRRRSHSSDPLTKVTFQLSESVIDAVRALVEKGEAASANAFVEEAIRDKLRELRRAKLYAAYEEASHDPLYMRDLGSDMTAFESTVADGLVSND